MTGQESRVAQPADSESASADERAFYDALLASRHEIVPVVGAGLAGAAGALTTASLISALAKAAGEAWVHVHRDVLDADLFFIVDVLARDFSDGWVNETVAAAVQHCKISSTPVLQALSKVSSKLILTTNYDSSIEVAAAAVGLPVRTLTLAKFDEALVADEASLRVLHLHGIASRPDTIVLTSSSYDAIRKDERAQMLVRDLCIRYRLLFLGHQLAPKEAHLRRDILWATQTSTRAGTPGRHVLLTSVVALDDPTVLRMADDIATSSNVKVVAFADPGSEHRATFRAAHVIAGPSSFALADRAVAAAPTLDTHYVPLPVARATDLEDSKSRGGYEYRAWRDGETLANELDQAEQRLLLVAGGGCGKTEELRQIGHRSSVPALFQTLTACQEGSAGSAAATVFVRWMVSATTASRHDAPRVSLDRLENEAFTFLLDGLDEVLPAVRRAAVIAVINEVAAKYPQHRWVVSSRPLPELPQLSGFVAWVPMPSEGWLHRYAEARAITAERVDDFISRAPGLADLARIPIFAASIVDHIEIDEELPRTAVELVWWLADQPLQLDRRIETTPELLQTWLDRLALLFEVSGTTEMPTEQLSQTTLHENLDGVAPSAELLNDLALRALLIDTAGNLRFPASVVQEARAARALLNAGAAGLGFLRHHVLVELPVVDAAGEPVRAVLPSWVNTIQLALPAAPSPWWEQVRHFDPVLCARATPTTADNATRHAAIRVLWRTYLERRVWFDRNLLSGPDDASALMRLLAAGPPDGFRDELLLGLPSDEPTLRANSLEALVVTEPRTTSLPLVAAALRDEHPVVRRKAAMAAFELRASELVDVIAAQAAQDTDELAIDTLTDIAIALADDDTAIRIAFDAPARNADRAMTELANKLPRQRALRLVRDRQPFSHRLLEALVANTDRRAVRDSWTPAEVATLARVVADHPDETRGVGEVAAALALHPVNAIAVRLCAAPDDWFDYELRPLLAAMNSDQLKQLDDLLADPPVRQLASLGVHGATGANPFAVDQVRANVQSLRTRPADPDPDAGGTASPAITARRPDAASLIAAGEWTALVVVYSPDSALRLVPEALVPDLRLHAAEAVAALVADGTLAKLLASWNGTVFTSICRPMDWAAQLDAPLSPADWPVVAEYGARWQTTEVMQWIRRWWNPKCWQPFEIRLATLPIDAVAAAAQLIPPPWPDGLAETALASTMSPQLTDAQRLRIASLVYEGAGAAAIRSWSSVPSREWLLPLLVEIGDCGAEQRLLDQLVCDPSRIPHWPLHYDTEWIRQVRCAESAANLYALLRAALIAGRQSNDLDAFFHALDRSAGPPVLHLYDELIADPQIPQAGFVYYRRQEALNRLAEAQARPAPQDIAQIEAEIIAASWPTRESRLSTATATTANAQSRRNN